MISDSDVNNRLRFIKHKGQAIFLLDFSHCQGKDMTERSFALPTSSHADASSSASFAGAGARSASVKWKR